MTRDGSRHARAPTQLWREIGGRSGGGASSVARCLGAAAIAPPPSTGTKCGTTVTSAQWVSAQLNMVGQELSQQAGVACSCPLGGAPWQGMVAIEVDFAGCEEESANAAVAVPRPCTSKARHRHKVGTGRRRFILTVTLVVTSGSRNRRGLRSTRARARWPELARGILVARHHRAHQVLAVAQARGDDPDDMDADQSQRDVGR